MAGQMFVVKRDGRSQDMGNDSLCFFRCKGEGVSQHPVYLNWFSMIYHTESYKTMSFRFR